MDDEPDGNRDAGEPARPRPPWLRWLPVAALAVAVLVLLGLVIGDAVGGHPAAAGATSSAPSSAATTGTRTSTSPPSTTAPSTEAGTPAEWAELRTTAAGLTRPLRMASPAGWDQYLPQGKPYPGSSTSEEMATCPTLASTLGRALGTTMSYWVGTLPDGPYGCSWVPVPLSYNGPYTYAYQLNVGYLADGTTTEQVRDGSPGQPAQTCPAVDVPAVGPGAVLVRCDGDPDGVEYTLALRDVRRAGGIWLLHASARAGARHTATQALDDLIAAVRSVYG